MIVVRDHRQQGPRTAKQGGGSMERLEAKQINGRTYYYYSQWARKGGRCRRIWQKYLGKLEDIVQAVDGGPRPFCAEVFQWGLPQALWNEGCRVELVGTVDRLCPKRQQGLSLGQYLQGLSLGQYLAVAAINRAMCPKSKRSMWEWFSQTVLLRHMPTASAAALSSQRFWDHMDRIDAESATAIWKALLHETVRRDVKCRNWRPSEQSRALLAGFPVVRLTTVVFDHEDANNIHANAVID